MTQSKLSDEAGRLASLRRYDVLDTPPEAPFDKITQLVKTVLDVPIVAVSLVDADRQWFKSCIGVDVRETARDISFCTYTIQSREPMVIPDASLDPKFAQNPLVTGPPHIASYAGAPLLTPDGYAIGSLCAIDIVPRQFEAWQIEVLQSFAALVVDEFELRRIAHADSLTGALSRRALLVEAGRAIAHFVKYDIQSAVVAIDIDNFRQCNIDYGHAAGDAMLRVIAEAINQQARPGDILARLGGDEFAVLLTETDTGQAMLTAERIRAALARLSFGHDPQLRISASFGIAALSAAYVSAEKWLAAADLALYEAKQTGRNKCIVRAEPAADPDEDIFILTNVAEEDVPEETAEKEHHNDDLEEHKGSVEPLSRSLWTKLQHLPRVKSVKTGRLAYGGMHPGIVNCRVVGLVENGIRVETSAKLSPMPDFFSVEFCDIYCRASMVQAEGHEIELAFIFDRA